MTRTATRPLPGVSRKAAATTTVPLDPTAQLTSQLRALRLKAIPDRFQESAMRAATENLSHLAYLSALTTRDCETPKAGRIRRLMTRSQLPSGKTLNSFDFARLPRHMETLREVLRSAG